MKLKKIVCMTMVGVIALGSFVGCGSSSSNSGKSGDVTLKVLTQRTDVVDTELKDFSDKYTEKTGVKIEWEAIKDYESDIKVRLNSNDYGDVLLLPSTMPKNEYPNFFESLGKDTDDDISQYRSNKLTAVRDGDNFNVYGLSYGVSAHGIVYNKEAFKKAGIDVSTMNNTKGFYDGCKKLKDAGILPVAINFNAKWPLSNWYSAAWDISGNGNFPNELYKEENVFDASKPMGKSLDMLYTLINNGWTEEDLTTTNWDQSKEDLATGKIGMMVLGTWAVPQLKELTKTPDDIGFIPVPTEDGKTYTLLSPDYALGVSNKSNHKKEARDFLFAFIDSDYAAQNGYIPNNKNIESTDKSVNEFLTSGVTTITQDPASKEDDGKFDLVINKGKVDIWGGTFCQPAALASKKSKDEYNKAINDLNDAWNKGREEVLNK